jgi:hypothetical protein
LEAKEALQPQLGQGTSDCLGNWDNATYPCDGDTLAWNGVCATGCSNGLVTRLCLNNCGFNGILPAAWGTLPGMEGVTDVTLIGNPNLAGPLPASWSRLTSLRVLYLFQNKLNGTLPPSWGDLSAMQDLRLWRNQLTGPLPPSWGRLANLERLDVDLNQLTGQLPERWGNLSALTTLFLSDNTALTGTLPCSWRGMANMDRLFLSSTNVTGCFPSEALEAASEAADRAPNVQGVRGEQCLEAQRGVGCVPGGAAGCSRWGGGYQGTADAPAGGVWTLAWCGCGPLLAPGH